MYFVPFFVLTVSSNVIRKGSYIVRRIRKNQASFEAKFDRKMKAETEFYKQVHSKKSQ